MIQRKWLSASALTIFLSVALSACGGETAAPATVVSPTNTTMAAALPTDTTAPASQPTNTTAPVAAPTDTTAATVAATVAGPTNTAAPTATMVPIVPITPVGTPDSNVSGTVTFWTAYNTVSPEMETLNNSIIPAFEKLYPNITVKAQAFPDTDMTQKLLTSIAGGQTPDLVRADIVAVAQFADMGALAPLDTELPDFNTLKGLVYSGPLQSNFYKGHYYGLPLDTNTRVLIYNKDVLSAAGITDAPKTWADFSADCDKVKALNKPDVYCYAEGGTGAWSVLPWIFSNGGDITNADYTKATGYLNGKATVDAVNMLKTMLANKTLSPGILGNGIATSDALGKGQTAFILDGPWMKPIFDQQYPGLPIGYGLVPSGAAQSSSVVGGEDIVMLENSPNKPAAEAFLRYMLASDAQTAMGQVGQMPVLQSLSSSPKLPDYYAIFQQQLKTAKPRTPSPSWSKIDDAVTGAVLSVLRGEKDTQAALDAAATTVDGLLAGNK